MATIVEHAYEPWGAARMLFNSRAREILMSGPAGTGKSRACLEKGNAIALKYPKSKGLIVRKVRDSLTSTGLDTLRRFVLPEALSTGLVRWYGGSAQEPPQYIYANGSRILIGGMDKATKIMSSEYDWIFVQEAIELDITDWESLLTRLRNGIVPYQQLFADTNPDTPTHWLKARCDEGKTLMLNSRHEDNPILFNRDGTLTQRGIEYIEGILDRLTGVRFLRLRRGQWVAAEGMIYEEQWSNDLLIDKFRPSKDWPRYWSIDFGYKNPFVCQFWAEDPDGGLVLYREIYRTGRLVEEHAKHILSLVTDSDGNWKEPRPDAIICDHDAEGRATLERHLSMGTTPAFKGVTEGIQHVQVRMRDKRIRFMRGATVERDQSLADAKKPTSTVEEIPGYVWNLGGGRKQGEEPKKEDDHGCDAKRYMVAFKDHTGEVNFRWLD